MEYELMTEQDYEGLPEDPSLKFVALEALCRRRVNELISNETPLQFDNMIRLQYISVVYAAAEELNISGVKYPTEIDEPNAAFNDFVLGTTAVVTRLRLRASTSRVGSVRLSQRSKGRIELELQRLERLIRQTPMSDDKREALLRRIDDFRKELSTTRLSFVKVMALLVTISVGISSGTSFLADGPEAIATITSIIGAEKEAEEAEAKRLDASAITKALPAPEMDGSSESAADADIPF